MKIYFCPECGSYSSSAAMYCGDCQSPVDEDGWAEVTDEEILQLEYVDDFDIVPGLPAWEYDVVRLKSDDDLGGVAYTTTLLNSMGDKGWELVNITPLGDKDGPRFAVFKRAWISDYEE